jgi:hypothetical protein
MRKLAGFTVAAAAVFAIAAAPAAPVAWRGRPGDAMIGG